MFIAGRTVGVLPRMVGGGESKRRGQVLCHAFIDGLCATAPHLQEALAEPVAHINTRLTGHKDATVNGSCGLV